MVARLQAALALFLATATLVLGWQWFCSAAAADWRWWCLPLLLLPHAPVLALEFLLLVWIGRHPKVPPPTVRQLARAWWGEVWCGLVVFGWRQPFRARLWPDVPGTRGRRGVILLHGIFCNRGLWNPWLRALTLQRTPCIAPTLEPVFGGIDTYAGAIDAAVRQMYRQTGLTPVLVGHSMGGLAARAWLAAQVLRPGMLAPVHAVVTVGTPHQGTWLARFALSVNARQMRMGSRWLSELAARETLQDRHRRTSGLSAPRFICYYGHADNIVFPANQACLAGAESRHLHAVAHVQMLFQPEVWHTVNALLRE